MSRRWPWVAAALGGAGAAALLARHVGAPLNLPMMRLWQFCGWLLLAGGGAGYLLRRGAETAPTSRIRYFPWVSAAGLAVVSMLLYGWVLRLDFLADDFFILTLGVGWGVELYQPQPGWHHFFPLGVDLNAAPYYIAGWVPFWFHLHQLLVAWVIALSVVALARQWGMDQPAALAAGLLWLTFPLQVEGVAWICITGDTYSALFALWSALAFDRYITRGGIRPVVFCCVAAAASMLCLEQGAALVPICWGMVLLRRRDAAQRPLAGLVAAAAAPAVVVGGLFLWKLLVAGQLAYEGVGVRDQLRTVSGFGWSILTPGSFAGLHVGLGLANRGLVGAIAGAVAAGGVAGLLFWRGDRVQRLGVGWAWAAGLPIVLGSPSIAPRHYMLPAVGIALVLAGWWSRAADVAQRRARAWVLACIVVAGSVGIYGTRPDYDRASASVRAVRAGLTAHVAPDTPYARVALVDLPWGVGEAEWPVLTFATGARGLTGWLRGDHDLKTVRAVRIWRTGPPGHTASEAEYVDADSLAAAAADPDQVVLRWNPAAQALERLGPPAP